MTRNDPSGAKPYVASFNNNSDPIVDGPGAGLGFNAGTLYPELTCGSEHESIRAAKIANIAYDEGYRAAQRDIRRSLGLEKSADVRSSRRHAYDPCLGSPF